jgi:hypothetical protein
MKSCSRSSRARVCRWVAIVGWTLLIVWTVAPRCATAQESPDEDTFVLPDIEAPCAPEVTENRRAVVVHGEDSGIWFHSDVARCLLGRLRLLPLLTQRVRLLDQRLTLSDERDALRTRQVALAGEEARIASDALEAAVRGRREAEEARDAWYRHPALWFTVGVVATVVLQVVAIWALSELD